MKYRVVIRAFTSRRDIASSIILARILKEEDCAVIVASSRNFGRVVRYWKPDAIIINTVSQINYCSRVSKNSKLILWPGEGGQGIESSDPMALSEMEEAYEKLSLVLLWGSITESFFYKLFPNHNHSKLVVCGNPRLDMIKFNEIIPFAKKSNSIGFIGRFHSLNRYNAIPAIYSMQVPEKRDGVIWQVENYISMIAIIRKVIEETDFQISIRPHPLEAPEGYNFMKTMKPFAGRVDIDDSFDLAYWTANQKVIITPSSTSFFESYLLKIPAVNIDKISNSVNVIQNLTPLAALSQKCSYMPEDLDKAIDLIKSKNLIAKSNSEVDIHLDEYHSWHFTKSATLSAKEEILKLLSKNDIVLKFYIPKIFLDILDYIVFKKISLRDNLHQNFSYSEHYHKIPKYYDNIVKNISKK